MQKCYNCGKEVDDNVLICPDCGALVKRYGKPEPARQEQDPAPFSQETAFDAQPQPRGAVWQREDGKLKFSGYVTFWLVLCAIYLGYTLLGFACTLLIYRFRDFYFGILDQFEELSSMAELLRTLLASLEAAPVYYIVVGVLIVVHSCGVCHELVDSFRSYPHCAEISVFCAEHIYYGGTAFGRRRGGCQNGAQNAQTQAVERYYTEVKPQQYHDNRCR